MSKTSQALGGTVHGVAVCSAWKRNVGTQGSHSTPPTARAAAVRAQAPPICRRRSRHAPNSTTMPTAASR